MCCFCCLKPFTTNSPLESQVQPFRVRLSEPRVMAYLGLIPASESCAVLGRVSSAQAGPVDPSASGPPLLRLPPGSARSPAAAVRRPARRPGPAGRPADAAGRPAAADRPRGGRRPTRRCRPRPLRDAFRPLRCVMFGSQGRLEFETSHVCLKLFGGWLWEAAAGHAVHVFLKHV